MLKLKVESISSMNNVGYSGAIARLQEEIISNEFFITRYIMDIDIYGKISSIQREVEILNI